jgi:hypothetical protein
MWRLGCLLMMKVFEKKMGLGGTSPSMIQQFIWVISLPYSHSMVAGGLLEMSKQTRLAPLTSLMMRLDIFSSTW